MKVQSLFNHGSAIVYDGDRLQAPDASLFDGAAWLARSSISGTAPGRGNTLFVESDAGPAVLRRYLRGGWAARLSTDRYLFTGYRRSRPFREFHLLAELLRDGFPVPAPLAAICQRFALTYRGALLTAAIPHAQTLADRLASGMDARSWAAVGDCIARFHAAGVTHADLNARNILIDQDERVFLLDFDRGSYRPGHGVDGAANLARLQRSLRKLWPSGALREFPAAWSALRGAYDG